MFISCCHDNPATSSSGEQQGDKGPQYRPLVGCFSDQQYEATQLALIEAWGAGAAVDTAIIICTSLPKEEREVSTSDKFGRVDSQSGMKDARVLGTSASRDFFRFYAATNEHQRYYEENSASSSYCSLVVFPKLQRLKGDSVVSHLITEE